MLIKRKQFQHVRLAQIVIDNFFDNNRVIKSIGVRSNQVLP